jgi:hypothetical protein
LEGVNRLQFESDTRLGPDVVHFIKKGTRFHFRKRRLQPWIRNGLHQVHPNPQVNEGRWLMGMQWQRPLHEQSENQQTNHNKGLVIFRNPFNLNISIKLAWRLR